MVQFSPFCLKTHSASHIFPSLVVQLDSRIKDSSCLCVFIIRGKSFIHATHSPKRAPLSLLFSHKTQLHLTLSALHKTHHKHYNHHSCTYCLNCVTLLDIYLQIDLYIYYKGFVHSCVCAVYVRIVYWGPSALRMRTPSCLFKYFYLFDR